MVGRGYAFNGIPYVGVSGSEARRAVTFVDYGSESDTGFRGEAGYPIPDAARTEPNFIEGGISGGGSGGDRHMLIVDRDEWVLFELFAARWNSSPEHHARIGNARADRGGHGSDLYITGTWTRGGTMMNCIRPSAA